MISIGWHVINVEKKYMKMRRVDNIISICTNGVQSGSHRLGAHPPSH